MGVKRRNSHVLQRYHIAALGDELQDAANLEDFKSVEEGFIKGDVILKLWVRHTDSRRLRYPLNVLQRQARITYWRASCSYATIGAMLPLRQMLLLQLLMLQLLVKIRGQMLM